MKVYVRRVVEKFKEAGEEERIPAFRKGATKMVNFIGRNYAKMKVYSKENDKGGLCFAYPKSEKEEDGLYLLYFKDGLEASDQEVQH